MTHAQQAAKAIKDATGWDAAFDEPAHSESEAHVADVVRPNGTRLLLWWWPPTGRWTCKIVRGNEWFGKGGTPEEAIAAVLPRYRAEIEQAAADIRFETLEPQ